jgi:hypothetical protein
MRPYRVAPDGVLRADERMISRFVVMSALTAGTPAANRRRLILKLLGRASAIKTPSSQSNGISESSTLFTKLVQTPISVSRHDLRVIKILIRRQILLARIRACGEGRFAITSKQRHDWQKLCMKALKEPDPEKQGAIVAELNRILQNESKKAQAAAVSRYSICTPENHRP